MTDQTPMANDAARIGRMEAEIEHLRMQRSAFYDRILRIEKLVLGAQIIADQMPVMHETDAPPVLFLIEEAGVELKELALAIGG